MEFFQGPTLCTLISTSTSLSFKYPSIINSYTSHFFSLRLLFLYLLYSVSFCFFLSLKKTQTSLVLLGTKKPTTIVVGFLLRRYLPLILKTSRKALTMALFECMESFNDWTSLA